MYCFWAAAVEKTPLYPPSACLLLATMRPWARKASLMVVFGFSPEMSGRLELEPRALEKASG